MVSASPKYRWSMAAAPLAAALGCLQPGIDPVFLTLLSQSSHLPPSAHGLIVGGTQAGAAVGSLAVWRLGPLVSRTVVILAATIALACSLITTMLDDLGAMLAVRGCYGLSMGMVYAYAMVAYAAKRPNRAFGAVFLIQLILSTLVSLLLPELERAVGAAFSLAILALAPATVVIAVITMPARASATGQAGDDEDRSAVPTEGWALAAATFWFICATMLIWSFSAGLATSAGLDNRTIGEAVSLGSLCGALTAVAVMREKLLVPLPVTALLASATLVAPVVMTVPGGDMSFIAAIVLLNIGSTAIIIRCSGLAAVRSTNSRFRAFVACTHSLGLIAGPLLGSAAMLLPTGLLGGLLLALSMGLGAVVVAAIVTSNGRPAGGPQAVVKVMEMALD